MTFEVSDRFYLSGPAVVAGNAAVGLWVRLGSWSAQQQTGGFIPAEIILSSAQPLAARLVSAGLWARVGRAWGMVPSDLWRIVTTQQVPAAVRQEVLLRDNYTCQECGTHDSLSLDHVVPRVAGGSNLPDNLQTLCTPCNGRKGARLS